MDDIVIIELDKLLIVPEGIEINICSCETTPPPPLLIVPEGIEIIQSLCSNARALHLLIVPEGIEMQVNCPLP